MTKFKLILSKTRLLSNAGIMGCFRRLRECNYFISSSWRSKGFCKSVDSTGFQESVDISSVNAHSFAQDKKLDSFIRINHYKLSEFSKIFNCSIDEAVSTFRKHKFLTKSKVSTIKKKVDILKEGGISESDLLKDVCVLTYHPSTLKERLERTKSMNFAPLRPWMLRCKETVIHRTWVSREKSKAAMAPHNSGKEYLCERLNLSDVDYEIFAAKHPPVTRVKMFKLKEIIDFLLSEGFTELQICHTPRVLCHSLATLEERVSTLKSYNCHPYTLSVLCKSKKLFNDFINDLKIIKGNT